MATGKFRVLQNYCVFLEFEESLVWKLSLTLHLMEYVSECSCIIELCLQRTSVIFFFVSVQFSDQYISIGTSLPQGYNIYGLGERKDHLRLTPCAIYQYVETTLHPVLLMQERLWSKLWEHHSTLEQ